jgi:small subunit ribosomal protein S2
MQATEVSTIIEKNKMTDHITDIPDFTIKQLLDAGVHFGHKKMRWNPKMAPYLYGSRDNIHIIDLQQTVPLLHQALQIVYDVVKNNGRVLFVGTKRQASDIISEAAKRCGQYYVNHRWLGGMLTNFNTVSKSIKTMKDLESKLSDPDIELKLTKKEILELTRSKDRLERSLGGIRDMGGKPDLLFIIDTNKESLAVLEANKLNIPVVAVIDSNSDPMGIDHPIPGNDDATRAIRLYCKLISDTALAGIQKSLTMSGADAGASAEGLVENMGDFLKDEGGHVERKKIHKAKKA